jgi:hypothetical protein
MMQARTFRATGSFRRDARGRIVVEARSRAFVARALRPMARVGRSPVIGVRCANGTLTGLVLGTPQAGAELVVRFVPEPERPTGVRFQLPPLNVA